jgi:hypothetical protein
LFSFGGAQNDLTAIKKAESHFVGQHTAKKQTKHTMSILIKIFRNKQPQQVSTPQSSPQIGHGESDNNSWVFSPTCPESKCCPPSCSTQGVVVTAVLNSALDFLFYDCKDREESIDSAREYAQNFLEDCYSYDLVSDRILSYAMVLLGRLALAPSVDLANTSNAADLFLALVGCCVIAQKILDDEPYNNKSFLPLSRLSGCEMLHLESYLLTALQFHVHVDVDEFNACLHKLCSVAM